METLFTNLVHFLFGLHPAMDFDDLIRLAVAFFFLVMLVGKLVGFLAQSRVQAWLMRHTRKKLARLGGSMGFRPGPQEKKHAQIAGEGTRRTRIVRFLTCRWRGLPMAAVAAVCPESADFRLRICPNSGRFWNSLLSFSSFRPQDFKSKEFRLRAQPTGDPSFDEAYLVKSTQPALVSKLLTQEMRNLLMTVRKPFHRAPVVTIADGEVRYALFVGAFTKIDPLAEKLDFVCDLAEAVKSAYQSDSPTFATPTAAF